MTFHSRVTDLLGIQYPIMQGGLQNLATPELAAAVSNAGGLGTINAASYTTIGAFQEAIRRTKTLTQNPICANISMLPYVSVGEQTLEYFCTAIEEGVRIVETSGRSPEPYIPMLKEAGVRIIHKVPSVKHAQTAWRVGADIISIVGVEGAGHPGEDEVSTLLLANLTAQAVNIPVIAGGGIADGRGLVAAFALGSEGVVMGTRFVATKECVLHDAFKRWIVAASERDTVLIQGGTHNLMRAMRNATAVKTQELERRGASIEELYPLISGKRGFQAQLSGDLDGGIFSIGQAVGLIHDIPTVKDTIEQIIQEAETSLGFLNSSIVTGHTMQAHSMHTNTK
ncbi:MAG: nitronate monooxygenase [Clostridia bacterium]|nr:nitronate monooxygenase [Clostridia bacterium]